MNRADFSVASPGIGLALCLVGFALGWFLGAKLLGATVFSMGFVLVAAWILRGMWLVAATQDYPVLSLVFRLAAIVFVLFTIGAFVTEALSDGMDPVHRSIALGFALGVTAIGVRAYVAKRSE